jgi:hypothetical protein
VSAANGRKAHPYLADLGRHQARRDTERLAQHIGYNTSEASANMLRIAIARVEAFARGERLHVVNGV